MSRTWGSFLQNNRRQNKVRRAIASGDLYFAADHVTQNRMDHTSAGKKVVSELTQALVARARESGAKGNLPAAWKDLSVASSVALRNDFDWLATEKSQLVELTVESADACLTQGKPTSALRLVRELRSRQILDWRADRIEKTALLVQDSECMLARGDLGKSVDRLMEARNLRPDLRFVESKLAGVNTRTPQFRALKNALQSALLENRHSEVERCCNEILAIAPNYQVALDARRRVFEEKRRQPTFAQPQTFYEIDDTRRVETALEPTQSSNSDISVAMNSTDSTDSESASRARPFMMWVDGVGGFLVCPSNTNFIGQAIGDSQLEIPMRGDLLRRHAKIESVGRTHLIDPLGEVLIDEIKIEETTTLRDGQRLALGPIKLNYRQPHPLSGTASLGFSSRHRTQPWSDGVLLVNGPVILGKKAKNHVICRTWTSEVLLFERNGKWFVRTNGKIEVDGRVYDNEAEVGLNSRVAGEDFSLSLEKM